jgi:putative tryptophan/tyrosine transport system substrate-binding protein
MRRREFIAGLGGTVLPIAARAQQRAMPVIGYLSTLFADDEYKNVTISFLQGLKETGYVEGRNVAIEYRWAEYQTDRLPALVADLVRRRVAVIVASGTSEAGRRRQRPRTYPSSLPAPLIRSHWVWSPASTGPARNSPALIANLSAELAPKQLQLLRELIPKEENG